MKITSIVGYRPRYVLLHPWVILEYCIDEVKYACQRVFRGWDDRAIWGFDTYLAKIIVEGLEEIAKKKQGIPISMFHKNFDENGDITEEEQNAAQKRWDDILETITLGFKNYLVDPNHPDYIKLEESFLLLSDHFGDLWT